VQDQADAASTALISRFTGAGQIVAGHGAISNLAQIIDSLGSSHICVVADAHVAKHKGLQDALNALGVAYNVTLLEHDGREPSLEQARTLAGQIARNVELIVAVGGGSTIDISKAVAIVKSTEEPLQRFEGANRIVVTPIPLVAIPTTAGTGSEVSGSCVLIDETTKRKMSIRSPRLRAKVAVLDPNLLASVPKGVIKATGVDALGHALEAYFSNSRSVITDRMALGAISLIMRALPKYYASPADPAAAEAMAWGATMAGIAFESARVGLAHAVAAGIGALTGLSHGICVGLALPAAVRINLHTRADDRDELMFHLGVTPNGDATWEESVNRKLAGLYESLEFPTTAHDAGRSFDVTDVLIKNIMDSGRLETNPVRITETTLGDVLNSIRR